MGKIATQLEVQMSKEGLQEYARQCKAIYDKLKEMDDGHVWSSKWGALVKISSRRNEADKVEFYYRPTDIGEIFLKGLNKQGNTATDERKHYEILIEGDGFSGYPARTVDVYCTRENLDIIAQAMKDYVYNKIGRGCCCLAKENGGVAHGNFDIMYADCI